MIPIRDSQPSYSTPVVTIALIITNVVVFFYQFSFDPSAANRFIFAYGIIPSQFEVSDLFTSMFLHGGWMHLIGNMWFLWIYGDNVEDILGSAKYLLFYLSCGLIAAVSHVVFNLGSQVPTIGASGAVAGVMGAYLVKFPRSRIVTLVPIFFFITFIEIPASLILVYWFLLQLLSGAGSIGYSTAAQGGIAWFAHIGGFVGGIILILVMRTRERYRKRRELHW